MITAIIPSPLFLFCRPLQHDIPTAPCLLNVPQMLVSTVVVRTTLPSAAPIVIPPPKKVVVDAFEYVLMCADACFGVVVQLCACLLLVVSCKGTAMAASHGVATLYHRQLPRGWLCVCMCFIVCVCVFVSFGY